MLAKPSLFTRIAVGKGIGGLIGLAGLVAIPVFVADAGWPIRVGILLWYTTIGGLVGLAGVVTRHPVCKAGLPWWVRGALIGGWMNFVLAFLGYDMIGAMMAEMFGPDGALQSPFWVVAEGAVVGFVVDFFATRWGGEGAATARVLDREAARP